MPEPALRNRDINWRAYGVNGLTSPPVTSSELRSVRDMTSRDNVSQAKWELGRCDSDAGFATWARRWGEALVVRAGAR